MDKIRSESIEKLLNSTENTSGSFATLLDNVNNVEVTRLTTEYDQLNPTEKILFLLRIQNNGNTNNRQNSNEVMITSNWLRSNFQIDLNTAIPKEDVYQMYKKQCTKLTKAVSTADFGKIVRQVFPQVKPRRLGQRGNSRYCYANIRKKTSPDAPILPSAEITPKTESPTSIKILNWANKTFSQNFESLDEFSNVLDNMADLVPSQQSQHVQKRGIKRNGSSCSLQQEKVPIPRLKREDSCQSDDPELQTYFCTDEKWPHLRKLLTNSNSTNSTAQFTPITQHFRPPSSVSNGNGKKKRHFSTATIIQQSPSTPQLMTPRSQSVPLNYDIVQSPFEDEYGGDSGIGSLSSTPRNPMLSSVNQSVIPANDNLILMPPNEQIEDQFIGFEYDPVFDIDFTLS